MLGYNISVTVTANDLPELPAEIDARLDQIVRKAAIDLQGWMVALISQQGLVDTGNLIGSIAVDNAGHAHAFVGTAVEYAPHTEYGTVHMAARPWAFPASQKIRPALVASGKQVLGGIG